MRHVPFGQPPLARDDVDSKLYGTTLRRRQDIPDAVNCTEGAVPTRWPKERKEESGRESCMEGVGKEVLVRKARAPRHSKYDSTGIRPNEPDREGERIKLPNADTNGEVRATSPPRAPAEVMSLASLPVSTDDLIARTARAPSFTSFWKGTPKPTTKVTICAGFEARVTMLGGAYGPWLYLHRRADRSCDGDERHNGDGETR